jgi:hypothetical protein
VSFQNTRTCNSREYTNNYMFPSTWSYPRPTSTTSKFLKLNRLQKYNFMSMMICKMIYIICLECIEALSVIKIRAVHGPAWPESRVQSPGFGLAWGGYGLVKPQARPKPPLTGTAWLWLGLAQATASIRLATSALCGAEIQIHATSITTRTKSPVGLWKGQAPHNDWE